MPADVQLRPPSPDDLADLVRAGCQQDIGWWGEEDTDEAEVRRVLDRAVATAGSLDAGARVATAGGAVVGWAALIGHGQSELVVDPSSPPGAERALDRLLEWLTEAGATSADAPRQDARRLAALARHGFREARSSFELERSADGQIPAPDWPDGIVLAPFRPGLDDAAVHALIYSVWSDVPGHTDRPFDEWRALFIEHDGFDANLVVVARHAPPSDAVAGVAVCRTFPSGAGWVSQLAVGTDARGIGVGRALLYEALIRLQATGVHVLGLSVEAANDTALSLYRSAGLAVTREWVVCTRP